MLLIFTLIGCDSNPSNGNSIDDGAGITTTGNNITAKFLVADKSDSTSYTDSYAYLFSEPDSTLVDSQKVDLTNGVSFGQLVDGIYTISVLKENEVLGQLSNIHVANDSSASVTISLTIITQIIGNDGSIITPGNGNIIIDEPGPGPIYIIETSGDSNTVIINTGSLLASSSSIFPSSSSSLISSSVSLPSSSLLSSSSAISSSVSLSSSSLPSSSSTAISSSVLLPSSSLPSSSSSVSSSSSDVVPTIGISSSFGSSSTVFESSSSVIVVVDTTYLSDMQDKITFLSEDSDDIEYDKNFRDRTIAINGIQYPKGIVLYRDSRIDFNLNSEWDIFEVVIGMDDKYGDFDPEANVHMNAVFEVFLDEVSVYVSPEMRIFSNGIKLKLDVRDKMSLRIETDEPDYFYSSYVTLADAKLISGDTIDTDSAEVIEVYTEPYSYLMQTRSDQADLSTGYNSCESFSMSNKGYVLCYNATTGTMVSQELIEGNDAFSLVETKAVGLEWTGLDVYTIGDTTYVAQYKRSDGTFEVRKIDGDGSIGDLKHTDVLDTGIVTMQAFSVGANNYLMYSAGSTGETVTVPIDENGDFGTEHIPLSWASPWTVLEFVEIDGASYLILGNSILQTHATYSMNSDGTFNTLIEEYKFIEEWTHVKAFHLNAKPHLFMHNTLNGYSASYMLNDDGTFGSKSYYRRWSSEWTTIETITLATKSYLYIMKGSSGRGELSELYLDVIAP